MICVLFCSVCVVVAVAVVVVVVVSLFVLLASDFTVMDLLDVFYLRKSQENEKG